MRLLSCGPAPSAGDGNHSGNIRGVSHLMVYNTLTNSPVKSFCNKTNVLSSCTFCGNCVCLSRTTPKHILLVYWVVVCIFIACGAIFLPTDHSSFGHALIEKKTSHNVLDFCTFAMVWDGTRRHCGSFDNHHVNVLVFRRFNWHSSLIFMTSI